MSLIPDFDEGKYVPFNRTDDIHFKQVFEGIPKSIMKFNKDKFLMDLIDDDDSDLGKIEGEAKARGGGYAKNLRYSIYNPKQAKFIIEYFTEPGYTILDPFSGRGTRMMTSLYLSRNYRGYDTSSETIKLNQNLLQKKKELLNSNFKCDLIHGDGTKLLYEELDSVDAVFSCPPYYEIEQYSGEEGDISMLKPDAFDQQIESMFENLYTVIKTSNYADKKYHPVIFTVGTIRRGKEGVVDMDFKFQQAAYKAGFVLYDKLFTENNTPGAGFTFRRNYQCGFLTKSHETTLVFMKF
jgi:DNA modification methylase